MANLYTNYNDMLPDFNEIDGKEKEGNFEPVTTEDLNKKVEEFEKKNLIRVSEEENMNMPLWKEILTDEDGNEYVGPKSHLVSYVDGKVQFIPPFLFENEKGNKYIHKGYLTEYLIENIPSIYSTGVLYLYDNGVYRPIKENEDKGIIKDLLTPKYSGMHTVNDVTKQWRIDYRINKFPEEINSNPYLLNIKNGTLKIEDKENWIFTEGHNPENLSTIQIQANYNKHAKGKNFKKFLESSAPDSKIQMLLQEMVGYCLTSFIDSKQMIFILTGQSNSGKSTFINATIEALLDESAKCHVPLQDLNGNEYNQAKLYGKIVNVFAELPDKPLKEIGYLKAASGKDPIPARRIYEAPFEFLNKAKFVFSANTLPSNFSSDTSDGYYNRLTLIPFDQNIKEKDPDLNKKLENEKDYILMWALEGLQRLMNNNWEFTSNEASEEMKADYKKSSNPIMVFVEEYCEVGTNNETSRVNLYTAWQNFCEQNGHLPGSQIKFNKNLLALYGDKVEKSQMNNSRRTKSWKGIRALDFDEI